MSFVSHSCVTRMPSVCHSYVLVCHPYAARMHTYVIRMSLICTCMPSVCTCMSSVYHSYVLVCHSYFTRMSLVCTRMSFVYHSYVIRMYLHVICMYSYVLVCHLYVTRMCGFTMNLFLITFVTISIVFLVFINKTLRLNNLIHELNTRTTMNVKIWVFVICVEPIIYLLLHNLNDCTFHVALWKCSWMQGTAQAKKFAF